MFASTPTICGARWRVAGNRPLLPGSDRLRFVPVREKPALTGPVAGRRGVTGEWGWRGLRAEINASGHQVGEGASQIITDAPNAAPTRLDRAELLPSCASHRWRIQHLTDRWRPGADPRANARLDERRAAARHLLSLPAGRRLAGLSAARRTFPATAARSQSGAGPVRRRRDQRRGSLTQSVSSNIITRDRPAPYNGGAFMRAAVNTLSTEFGWL
jgi:hypothetical protein